MEPAELVEHPSSEAPLEASDVEHRELESPSRSADGQHAKRLVILRDQDRRRGSRKPDS